MSRIDFTKTRLRRMARRLAIFAMPLWLMLAPVIVWAESAAPNPALKKAPPAWVGMAVMFVLAGLVIFVSLLPSKRGHQD